MESLKNLLKILAESKIEFVVIGGYAAVMYGSSQLTRDIDICVSLTIDNIQRLREILAPYHPVHRMTPQKLSFIEIPENLEGLKNLYLKTDLGVVDILGELPGVGTFTEIASRATELQLFGQSIKLVSLEDLIQSKKIVGRPKDQATILELNVIKEKGKLK